MLALLPQRGLHRRKAVTRVSLACREGWRAAGTFGGRRCDSLMCVSVARLLARRLCFPPSPLRTDAPLSQGGNVAPWSCCCCACLTEPRFQRIPRHLFMSLSLSFPPVSSSFHLLSVATPPSHARTAGFALLHLEVATGMLQQDEPGTGTVRSVPFLPVGGSMLTA